MEINRYPEHLVFGLDIGTRSIVGTVGYKETEKKFIVIAQVVKLHETRAMMDGQIHDINKVSETIGFVKNELERKVGRKLDDVCIAAAGRVLKTVTATAECEFQTETVVTDEQVHSLDLMAVEKAYDLLREEKKTDKINFYCVGYSIIRYYLNDYAISNLEGHKALKIKTELIATFLPEEVVDGLHTAVEKAGLFVANLTLEPIAAIQIAIPEKFRLLNLALIDVGAGTSDISITKDGSIIAFGMIPYAGDEITEVIAKKYLTDFETAESIKIACMDQEEIIFEDIIGIKHHVTREEVLKVTTDTVKMITENIAKRIIRLNGGKPVSATFVVGGGGKIPGFTKYLAQFLAIPEERVALRGEEVMRDIEFLEDIQKDALLITPIGICLNYYEHKNNFIFVNVNGQRIKLYDNDKLSIVDAAIQVGFPNETLFPRRGKPLNFTLNGEARLVRGEAGEAAVVRLNGVLVGINSSIEQNDKIEIEESTVGKDAVMDIGKLPEFRGTIQFVFNGKKITCPKFAMVNGSLVSEFYSIQEDDAIVILNYYTLKQVLEFMDVEYKGSVMVNHVQASLDDLVYENFTIDCVIGNENMNWEETRAEANIVIEENAMRIDPFVKEEVIEVEEKKKEPKAITVTVNGTKIHLTGKTEYILVNILDVYAFDISTAKGSQLITTVNGGEVEFTHPIRNGDYIAIYWKD